MFQCENDLYESKCIKITTTTTTTTTECFLKARQKNSDALKNTYDTFGFLSFSIDNFFGRTTAALSIESFNISE